MLVEFTVGNFKSFRDATTFSMIAANIVSADKELDVSNTIPVNGSLSLLTSAAIYGANASGKSNLGVALKFMRNFVLNSSRDTQAEDAIPVEPFLLDATSRTQPSHFEILFLLDNLQYRYGFEADSMNILSEWCYSASKTRETLVFLREKQNFVRNTLRGGKQLEDKTRSNSLYLSVAAQFNEPTASRLRNWFIRFAITSGLQDEDFRGYTVECLANEERKQEIVDFVQKLDLGIDDLRLMDPFHLDALPSDMSEDAKRQIVQMFADKNVRYIYTVHNMVPEPRSMDDFEMFNLDIHESQGTRKLIAMAGPLISVLKTGSIIFIDELDARIHPHITREIVRMFNSKKTNANNAQLIFITHDTNLLDRTLFRRDQIWFSEKDKHGATHLSSLVEYKPRNDAAYAKDYIQGRYGAVPYLGDFDRLPEVVNAKA